MIISESDAIWAADQFIGILKINKTLIASSASLGHARIKIQLLSERSDCQLSFGHKNVCVGLKL